MARWLIAALVAGALGCHEEFDAPPEPDLYKSPHDLGLDFSAESQDHDLAAPQDLGVKDLATHPDQG